MTDASASYISTWRMYRTFLPRSRSPFAFYTRLSPLASPRADVFNRWASTRDARSRASFDRLSCYSSRTAVSYKPPKRMHTRRRIITADTQFYRAERSTARNCRGGLIASGGARDFLRTAPFPPSNFRRRYRVDVQRQVLINGAITKTNVRVEIFADRLEILTTSFDHPLFYLFPLE